jgi:hypothetical protein
VLLPGPSGAVTEIAPSHPATLQVVAA